MSYNIKSVTNGWVISWEEDSGGERLELSRVFEIPDDFDTQREDPEKLVELLYFVKEEICGQYSSKHKKSNVVITLDCNLPDHIGEGNEKVE